MNDSFSSHHDRRSDTLLRLVGAVLVVLALGAHPATVAAIELTGVVSTPDGTPLANVDLDIDDLILGVRVEVEDDDTNPQGRYTLNLAPGIYRLTFEPPPGALFASRVVTPIDLRSDMRLDVTLEYGVSLTGRVTNPTGRGVANVKVDVLDLETNEDVPLSGDTSNALGFYSVILPVGTYRLDFQPPTASRLVPVRVEPLTIEENGVMPVALVEGMVIGGRALDPSGAPVVGVDADVVDLATGDKIPVLDDRSDDDGRFTLVLASGHYELRLGPPVESRLVTLVVDDLVVEGDTALSFELTAGVLVSGTVTEGLEAEPIARADLDFVRLPEGRIVPTSRDFTDVLGRYAVVIRPGLYDVVATPPAGSPWAPDTTRAVDIEGDMILNVRIGVPDAEPQPAPPVPVLLPAYPNPTSGTTTIPLRLDPDRGRITVRIYDAQGRFVRELADRVPSRVESSVVWDRRSQSGAEVAAGVYFVRAQQGPAVATARILVIPTRR